MTAESIFHEIKQALNGRPGQAIVLGVCQTLAARIDKEVWTVRLAAIVVGVFWTLPMVVVYIVAGFLLPETENRTRGFFTGLGILVRQTAGKARVFLGRLFGPDPGSGSRYRSY